MIDFRLTRPQELTQQEIALWDRLQHSFREFESPYFRPEFTQAVASIRDDVEVVVIEENGQAAGFFPFQRSSLNLGKPVAGRLNDFHGVILPRGFRVDVRDLIKSARLASWDFDHFVGDQPSFIAYQAAVESAPYLDLSKGFAAYHEERKKSGTEVIRKTLSRERKFQREVGELQFEFEASNPDETFAKLIEWKSAQFVRTGFTNVFAFPWVQQLLRDLQTGKPQMTGVLSVLRTASEPVAIAYCLRSFNILHAWFITYNPQYSTYSPGMIMMLKLAEQAANAGIRRIHLGAGDQRFKQSLANGAVQVSVGTVEAPTLATVVRDAWRWTRTTVAQTPLLAYCKLPGQLLKPVRGWMAFR